jgi:hypothetical protein
VLAIAIGTFLSIGGRIIFVAALERPFEIGDLNGVAATAAIAAIPFLVLAKRSSARLLPWLLSFALTCWVHWWWVSKGIAYQKAPDGSGVDFVAVLIVLLSPLPITGLAVAADKILQRNPNVR